MLVLPMLLGSLVLGPAAAAVVRRLHAAAGRDRDRPARTPSASAPCSRVLVLFVAGFIILMTSFRRTRLGVGGTQGESMLVDLRDRIQSQGGIPTCPTAGTLEWALRSAGGTPFAGDFIVTVPLRRPARRRRRRRLRQGRGRRHPRAAALGCVRRPARRAAARRVPAGRQRLPAPAELGRGLRHRRPPLARRRDRRVRDPHRRSPARRPAQRRVGSLDRPLDRGAGARPDRGRRVPLRARAPCARATRSCSTPTAWSRPRAATSCSASTGCSGQAEQLLRGQFEGGARRMIDALGSPHDDRALLLLHRVC